MASPGRDLDVVQRWFQAVITHPGGVDKGIESEEARRLVYLRREELEKMVRRSNRLSAHDRLSIYANAYYARLLECLGEDFPVFKRTVGQEIFNEFAFGYLQAHPSRSYTLTQLGDHFADYLDQTRPDRGEHDKAPSVRKVEWPDFLIDLVRLEWTIAQVFDGPGIEKAELISTEQWRSVPARQWPQATVQLVPCLKLLQFHYSVNDFYTAARTAEDGKEVPVPDPCEQWIAVTRRDFVVRRYELSRPEHALLDVLQSGRTVGEAIVSAADATDMDDDQLFKSLAQWFSAWTARQFFLDVHLPE